MNRFTGTAFDQRDDLARVGTIGHIVRARSLCPLSTCPPPFSPRELSGGNRSFLSNTLAASSVLASKHWTEPLLGGREAVKEGALVFLLLFAL